MSEETKNEKVENENVEEATAEEVDKTEKDNTTQQESGNEEKTIPYWRFKEVVDEKNQLSEELSKLQKQIEEMDDPEKIKEQMKTKTEELENKNKDFLRRSEVKVEAIANGIRKEALNDFLKAKSDEIKQLEVDGEEVKGVEDFIKDVKEKSTFYFGDDNSNNSKTAGDFNNTNKEGDSKESTMDRLRKKANLI